MVEHFLFFMMSTPDMQAAHVQQIHVLKQHQCATDEMILQMFKQGHTCNKDNN